MAKRKSNNYIYPLHSHPNMYDWGGDFKQAFGSLGGNFKEAFSGANMGNLAKQGAGMLGGLAGSALGNTIGGGLESGAGSAIGGLGNAVGDIAMGINPLLGGAIKLGSGLLGGLTNKMFGTKINREKVNAINASNAALASTVIDAGSNENILGQWASQNFGDNFTQSDVGSDGWFSNKAKNLFNKLQKEQVLSRQQNLLAYDTGINTVDTQTFNNALANFSAYGGPINMKTDASMSPFGNRLDDGGEVINKGISLIADNYSKRIPPELLPYKYSLDNIYQIENPRRLGIKGDKVFMYDKRTLGPGIDVKSGVPEWYAPALAGELTLDSVNNKAVELLRDHDRVIKNNYDDVYGEGASDTLSIGPRFLAAQARYQQGNLRKNWKNIHKALAKGNTKELKEAILEITPKGHQHRIDWINDFQVYANGGGLSRSKNYGSSKKPYPSVSKGDFAGGGRSYPIPTKADAIDALRLAGLHGRSDVKAKVYKKYPSLKHAMGGPLMTNGTDWTNGLTIIGNGGSHEENPFEGVQMGVDEQGVPNLVEEGEVVWNDYVFSNRLKPTEQMRKQYKLKGETFADAVKYLQKESEERPNDPISKKSLDTMLSKIATLQESIREKKENKANKYKHGGKMCNILAGPGEWPNTLDLPSIKGEDLLKDYEKQVSGEEIKPFTMSNFRKTPLYAAGTMAFTDLLGLTNKPDYEYADRIEEMGRELVAPQTRFKPVGSYIKPSLIDPHYLERQLEANAAAGRRAVTESSEGNRGAAMAGILASDYNTLGKLGESYMTMKDRNAKAIRDAAEYNRATDMYNSEGLFKEAMTNADLRDRTETKRLGLFDKAITMRQAEDAAAEARRTANMNNFLTSVTNYGIDAANRKDMQMLIESGAFGTLSQKPYWMSDAAWQKYQDNVNNSSNTKANGGKIRRRKKGLTY